VGEALDGAVRRFKGALRGSDVLHVVVEACVAGREPGIRAALEPALVPGTRLEDVRDVIDVYNPVGADSYGFDGTPAHFAPELLAALTDFADAFAKEPAALRPVGLELLLACVLDHPDAPDRDFLRVLDFEAAAAALRRRVRLRLEPPPSLWDEASGRLRSEEFTADAWAVLEQAARIAADLGYDTVLTPHCLLALLAETEGLADRVVRRQLSPQVGVARAAAHVAGAFRLLERGLETAPALRGDEIGSGLHERLRAAQLEAAAWGAERVDVPYLLLAVLESPPERLVAVLRAEPLSLDVARMHEHVLEAMRESRADAPREVAYKLPASLPPAEDLTWLAHSGAISEACHVDRYFDALCRALHRGTDRHVLITGLPGVGRTTLLRELARRADAGEIPFLRRRRFVRVDCRDVAPDRSAAQLISLISHVGGRTDLVLCVDGLGPLLRGPNGARNNLLLRSALEAGRIHLIGVLTGHDYEDLIATDHELLELTSRVEVAEPDQAAATDMVRHAADELAGRFDLEVSDAAVHRSVVLAGDFMPRHRLPLSAVKALQRACENLDYTRNHTTEDAAPQVGAEQVVHAVSELTGVPTGQLGGAERDAVDYEGLLSIRVVGQEVALRTVAKELRRIKSGLAGVSSGPASVLLFAGLTGVGKTELAKAVADLYSASKRLQTYPMENFTEPHSVSAFLGPPPGYVGHEAGGRLINELNADPYCVFLLDEAEKAHPEVLRPFLNLFDEGWIVDQRGVKAYGDRAIFILTSNAGHEVIAQMSHDSTDEEIGAAVRERLRELRTRRDEPVFTAELLARIRRVVVFRPLDLAAMEGICRKVLDRQRAFWREKREKELVVAEEVVRYVAMTGNRRNIHAGGGEGGRIIAKILGDMVEDPVTIAARDRPAEFEACRTIEVCFDPSAPHIAVRLHAAEDAR
jgi:ATP-dependent Clp protease ATP-binding subunit ClpA